jgi:hypothetical protein
MISPWGVAGNGVALQGPNAQPLQHRLVLLGLAVHADRSDDASPLGGLGGEEKDAGHLVAAAAAAALAVQGRGVAPVGASGGQAGGPGVFVGVDVQGVAARAAGGVQAGEALG